MRGVLTRRDLLRSGAAAAFAPAAASLMKLVPKDSFTFVALGDLHYDNLEHHDMTWLMAEKPNDLSQIKNYSRISEEVLPKLLDEVRSKVASEKADFVLQLGDFTEGLCGTPELAQRQIREFIALVEEKRLGAPMWAIKGNHDVTGPGSVEAYRDIVHPWQTKATGTPQTSANMSLAHKGVRFLMFDAYVPESLEWAEAELEKRTERLLVFSIHPPVVPYGARADWHIFAKPKDAARRERLLELLGRHEAYVLCGHLHKYGTVTRTTPKGRFVQTDLVSVLPRADLAPKDASDGIGAYGPDLVNKEPGFSPKNVDARRALLAEEKPHIRSFEYADAPGYAVIRIDGERVTADIHVGLGRPPWHALDLTAIRNR